ncbi:hypothetical protein Tco_1039453 [Tanacetum coccineum]
MERWFTASSNFGHDSGFPPGRSNSINFLRFGLILLIIHVDGVGGAGIARSSVPFFAGVAGVGVSGGLCVAAKVDVAGTNASGRDLLQSNAIGAILQSVDTNMLSN